MALRPLAGLSILVADDDALGGFRVRQRLVRAGARVALTDVRGATAYLRASELAAVAVGTLLRGPERDALLDGLAGCAAPWVVYGDTSGHAIARDLPLDGGLDMLVATLEGLCAPHRH